MIDLFITVSCNNTDKNVLYPDIIFQPMGDFVAQFDSIFYMYPGMKDAWKKGIDAAYEFMDEANKLIGEDIIYKPECL